MDPQRLFEAPTARLASGVALTYQASNQTTFLLAPKLRSDLRPLKRISDEPKWKKAGVCNHYGMIFIHSGEAELELRAALSIFRLAFQHNLRVG